MYFTIITLLCIPYLMVRPIMFYYVNLSQRLNFSFIFWLVLARQLEAVTNSGFKLKHIIPNQSDKPGSMQKKRNRMWRAYTGKRYHDHDNAFTFQYPVYLECLLPWW